MAKEPKAREHAAGEQGAGEQGAGERRAGERAAGPTRAQQIGMASAIGGLAGAALRAHRGRAAVAAGYHMHRKPRAQAAAELHGTSGVIGSVLQRDELPDDAVRERGE